ncbi:MAG: glycoside hydrolase family 3 N-terminal domain-containing protein [Actinomycetota bacterium]
MRLTAAPRHRTALLGGALLAALLGSGCTATPGPAPPVTTPPGSPAATGASPVGPSATPTRGNPGGLSDAQLVGQLFMAHVYGGAADEVTSEQGAANLALYGVRTPREVVQRFHLGGVVLLDRNTLDPARPQLSTGNVDSAAQIRRLTVGLQAAAQGDTGQPLLVAVDQEGGRVQRIRDGVGPLPSQAELAGRPTAQLRCTYRALGAQLRNLGVNQDLAPVADVARSTAGVIGDRSFGADVARTTADVRAAVDGLQGAGVLATLKHWPGHGATTVDSHRQLPVLGTSWAEWQRVDRAPFAAAAGTAKAVMVGHLALPAVTRSTVPATLSPALVRGELRDRLGFDGLVLTDSLWMQPMTAAGNPSSVARRALAAGNDILLMPVDLPAVFEDLLAAVRQDPALRGVVRDAVRRILAAKQWVATAPPPVPCRP